MIRQLALAAAVVLFSGFTPETTTPRNPIGENLLYQLDRNGSRTTSMIQSGSAVATVTDFIPDHQQGPSYNVNLDYDFVVQFYGRQKGSTRWAFAQEFFDEEFLVKLRETGYYETPDYKIRHEGFADARNLDGNFYPNCDKILIYDVKIPEARQSLESIIYSAAGYDPNAKSNPPIEDLKIRGHLFAGIPVLGAVKLDLSGVVQGMNAKAGFDYKK